MNKWSLINSSCSFIDNEKTTDLMPFEQDSLKRFWKSNILSFHQFSEPYTWWAVGRLGDVIEGVVDLE